MSRVRIPAPLTAVIVFIVVAYIGFGPASAVMAKGKIKVEKADQLPRHTYAIDGKPSELIKDAAAFDKLAAQVKKTTEGVLDEFEIGDANTLQQYYNLLQSIAFLSGDFEAARTYLEKSRALEDKEARKLTMGLVSLSYIDAVEAGAKPGSDEFREKLRENIAARLETMPWDVVQDLVERLNGQMSIFSENLLVGVLQNQMDPAVAKSGNLSGEQATQLIGFRSAMLNILPYKEDIAAVLGEVIASHKVDEKKEIWSARSIDFDGKEGYTPVVVGIWDSGVDVNVFAPSQRFTNPKEKPDNKDDDGNGFVDDIHGIAFDIDHEKTTGLLYPLGDQEKNRRELEDQAKGFTDLNAAVDSPEATEIKKKLSGLSPDAVKPFIESLGLYSFHAHGTHVAGIALAGDPYARVLVARLTFDHRMVPRPFTMEMLEKFAKECGEVVEYFKENNVRVVNMSWGFSISEIESNLEVNGIGATAEERAEMARKMFQVVNRALYKAMKGAPNILFVAAAGNSNNNVEFDEFIPSGYDLPNLIVAGAVDQAGDPTSFTSFGKTVVIYANGFEVESYVPGGRRIAFSGTSMASPNVANLAAKLVARDEKLEPSQVIDLIVGGADLMGEDKKLPVMNPKRSLELLEKEISSR